MEHYPHNYDRLGDFIVIGMTIVIVLILAGVGYGVWLFL